MKTRLNVGCGQSPTPGFKNYDNSWTVRFANSKLAALSAFLPRSVVNEQSQSYLSFVRASSIHWADVTKGIPEPTNSVEVLYSSHMLEHLDRDLATNFLNEARRVLVSGAIIRLAVPDIHTQVHAYIEHEDADLFIDGTNLVRAAPRTFMSKMRYLVVGDRHHKWMYDGKSLCRLLSSTGFVNAQVMEPGATLIKQPGALNLRERETESVFVEAVNP